MSNTIHIDKQTIIAVVMGGISAECEISMDSGKAIADCLEQSGYMVLRIVIDTDNTDIICKQLTPAPDIVFNALHGTFGEDGGIQAILNNLQIPYTHSGYRASKIAMDKPQTIRRFQYAGIPVAPSVRMHAEDFNPNSLPFPMPYVIKPAKQGSSVGLYIVHKPTDIPDFTDWQYGDIMVEKFISGTELTVSVVDDHPIGITELIPHSGVYDYEAKYTDGKTVHMCNGVSVDDKVVDALKSYALMAHTLLGCRGVSRTDFRYDPDTGYIATLETNTHPGMTNLSLLPEQAKATGMSFLQLLLKILQMAKTDVQTNAQGDGCKKCQK